MTRESARRLLRSDAMRALMMLVMVSVLSSACSGEGFEADAETVEAGEAGEPQAGAPSGATAGQVTTGGAASSTGGASGESGQGGSTGGADAGEPSTGGFTTGGTSNGGFTTGGTSPTLGGNAGNAGATTSGAGGSVAGSGNAGAAGSSPWPTPMNVGACDPDGPGPEASGYEVIYLVMPGTCLSWSNAPAKKVLCGVCERYENNMPGECATWSRSEYTHDPGTGAAVSLACGMLTVFPGEGARQVRLGAGVVPTYAELDPNTGVCPTSCGSTRALRDACISACTSMPCCYVDEARRGRCDGAPMCDGIDAY